MNLRDTDFYKMLTLPKAVEVIENYENELLGEAEYLTAWQYMADTDAWKILQGWYGRQLCILINQGLIEVPEELYE